jgi:hypothetical protein
MRGFMGKVIEEAALYSIDQELEIPDCMTGRIPDSIVDSNDLEESMNHQILFSNDHQYEEADVLDHELVQAIREAGL